MPSQVIPLIAVVTVMFSVIGGLSLLAHHYSLGGIKAKTVGDGQHGTARFAAESEIKKTYTHVPFEPEKWRQGQRGGACSLPAGQLPQGLVVGCKAHGGAVTVLVDTGDIHCLMIGAAGVGKTAHFLYPNIEYACASGMSWLCTDTKGDLLRCYAGIAQRHYYTKLYHGEHIPFHYVMMVGYDDEMQCIYLKDCGKAETQSLPYDELRLAWNCSYPGLSKPNTVCTVRMNSSKNKYEIAKEAMSKKCELFLNPPVGFIGYRGFCKFITELPNWKKELSKEDYNKLLANMVQFFGTVPTVPNALCGIDQPDEMAFGGGFDKANVVLTILGKEYGDKNMMAAAHVLGQGAAVISKIKDVIVDYLVELDDNTDDLPVLFTDVAEIMKQGFLILSKERM